MIQDPELLAADHVVIRCDQVLSPGWLRIEGGRVAQWGEGPPPPGPVLQAPHSILFPGFVNAHAHLALGKLRGQGDGKPFLPWLRDCVLPALAGQEDSWFAAGAEISARQLLRSGVTTVADAFFRPEGAWALHRIGLRGVFFHEVFGSRAEDLAAYQAQVWAELDQLASRLPPVSYGYSPHTPWTCPPPVLDALARRARDENRRVMCHVSESVEELDFFRHRTGELAEWLGRRGGRYSVGMTPLEALDALGVLGPDFILVHGVQLTPSDVEIVAKTGSPVVHCPISNLKLAEGVAPIKALRDAGVLVGLGTDSLASNGSLDFFQEMRTALLVQRGVCRTTDGLRAADGFAMATSNGAHILGLADGVGSLDVGRWADLARVRFGDSLEGRDPLEALVWSGSPSAVDLVMVGGNVRLHRPWGGPAVQPEMVRGG